MATNGIARAEDFRNAAATDQGEPLRLVLPKSGFPVLVRKLTPLRVLMQSDRLARLGGQGVNDPQASVEFARVMVATIQEVLVKPKLSLTPGVDEIDPNWLPEDDARFLFHWGLGLVADDGSDLAGLFRKQGSADSPGHAGGGGTLPAQRDSRDPGGGGAARG